MISIWVIASGWSVPTDHLFFFQIFWWQVSLVLCRRVDQLGFVGLEIENNIG